MSKFVVTVFDSEDQARKASAALCDLHSDSKLVLFSAAVITKDENGHAKSEDTVERGPLSTATGAAVGTLLAGVGGMVAGAGGGLVLAAMAAGAAAGTATGMVVDSYSTGISGDFLEEVSGKMQPGSAALVADLMECWTTPLDDAMHDLGGTVFRRTRIDVKDEVLAQELSAASDELQEITDEWQSATDAAKSKLEAKVGAAREKLESLVAEAESKVESIDAELDAKVAKLDEQIDKAVDEAQQKFEQRKLELKKDFQLRSEKLRKAAKLARSTLT